MEWIAAGHENMHYVKYKNCGHIQTGEARPEMLREMADFACGFGKDDIFS